MKVSYIASYTVNQKFEAIAIADDFNVSAHVRTYIDLLQHEHHECQKKIGHLQETVEHLKTDKVWPYTTL